METTLYDEMLAAGRGTWGILRGDRRAPGEFDFTLRGLVGSFIALVVAVGLNVYLPLLMGLPSGGLDAWQAVLIIAFVYAMQLGLITALLNKIGRLDGLVPYLVADNWATFFLTVLSTILTLLGLGGDLVALVAAVVVLVIEVNIARLVVTLKPMQVVFFLLAQLAGGAIGLVVLMTIVPPPPVPA